MEKVNVYAFLYKMRKKQVEQPLTFNCTQIFTCHSVIKKLFAGGNSIDVMIYPDFLHKC